jgi:hypothetical protein
MESISALFVDFSFDVFFTLYFFYQLMPYSDVAFLSSPLIYVHYLLRIVIRLLDSVRSRNPPAFT